MKKKQNIKKIASVIIVVLLVIMMILPALQFYPAQAATKYELQGKISGLKSELSEIKSYQSELNKTLAEIKEDKLTKIEKISALSSEITLIEDELETVYEIITEYEALIEEKYEEKVDLEEEISAQRERLGGILKMSYEYGDDNYMTILLGSKDFGDFLSRLDYLSYFMGSSKNILEDLSVKDEELTEITKIYEESLTSIEEYRASSESLQEELEAKKAEEEAELALLNEEEAKELAALEEYEKSRKETEREIANLSASLKKIEDEERRKALLEEQRRRDEANKNNNTGKNNTTTTKPASTYSGNFGWPLNGYNSPGSAYISSGYGYRTNPITRRSEFHNGIDLPAPSGTPIYSPADGTVSSSGVRGGYGNCVVIAHSGGVVTLYGHCSSLNVVSGQKVKKGDLIGRVGTTGQSTGNHLHYTIYEGGATVSPLSYY